MGRYGHRCRLRSTEYTALRQGDAADLDACEAQEWSVRPRVRDHGGGDHEACSGGERSAICHIELV